ncbi:MAG: MATE family efflux transporter [Candidatus Sumerlaeia bacterium]|nr:MATE family efflux transporter [Candidatus Sumerlaeia bacterium]
MSSSASTWWRSSNGPARLWVAPRWEGDGGVRQLLLISLPLVINGLTGVINLFFDRFFLARYDLQYHMPATQGAGATWWCVQALLLGVATYSSTFVAQYHGANRQHRIGPAVWQGIHLAFAGGVLNLLLLPLWGPLFHFVHEDTILATLETQYCRALGMGSVFLLFNGAASAFYAGRGRTTLVMVIGLLVAVVNVLLNRWLIFAPPAWLPFIEPGVLGAAWGTIFSLALGSVIYLACLISPSNERRFATRRGWRFDPALCGRLLRFGLPQGFHFFVEVLAFTFFFLMIGRVSLEALIASNIAMTVNHLIFVPMMGIAQSVGILVGRFQGRGDSSLGERATALGVLLNCGMMAPALLAYALTPDIFINLFVTAETAPVELDESVRNMTRMFLLVVVAYSFGDVANLTYASAIKGAGDTRFVLVYAALTSFFLVVVPCTYLGYTGGSPLLMWGCALVFVTALGVGFLLRYRGGHWKSMQVIESEPTT